MIPFDFADGTDTIVQLKDLTSVASRDLILVVQCEAAVCFFRIAQARAANRETLGSPQDVETRVAFHNELHRLLSKLPPETCYPSGQRALHHYLRCVLPFSQQHTKALLTPRPAHLTISKHYCFFAHWSALTSHYQILSERRRPFVSHRVFTYWQA